MRPSPLRRSARFPGGKQSGNGLGGGTPNPHRRGLRPLWTLPPDRGVRRGAEPGGGSRAAPTRMERRGRESAHTGGPLRGKIEAQTAILPQEVRPLPWREAERKGVGGGTPPTPHQRGLRPLWTLPPDRGVRRGAEPEGGSRAAPTRMERRGRESAHTGGPLRGKIEAQTAILPQEVRPLPWREAGRIGVGGYPQAPTKVGYALSGLSRRNTGIGALTMSDWIRPRLGLRLGRPRRGGRSRPRC